MNYDEEFSGDYYPDSPVPKVFEPSDIDWTEEESTGYMYQTAKEEKPSMKTPWGLEMGLLFK